MSLLRRPLAVYPDMARWWATEEGKRYRGHTQRLDPVFDHVKRMDAKVNGAPARGNPNGWRYRGSIPMVLVIDFCQRHGATFDQWARDEGGLKQRFLREIQTREYHRLWSHKR